MTDTWYIDYSAKALDGNTIAGTRVGPNGEFATGAIRYIDDITNPSLVRTKHVTRAEYASLTAAGLALDAMYMEVGVNDPLGGYVQGQAYARRALVGADALGFDGKLLFCADRWFVAANRPTITPAVWQDYLDGAVSVVGRDRAGAYGFADAMDAARGHVDFFVQCGARSAVRSFVNGWQDNNVQPIVGGIQTDRVLILNDFTPAPSGGDWFHPTGNLDLEDDDMITVPAGNDDHVNVIVKGKTALYLACSWNRKVQVAALFFYGDTGSNMAGTPVGGARTNLVFDSNRPGPIAIPPSAAMATIRYTADHSFAVGVA